LGFSVGTSATSIGLDALLKKYPHEPAGFVPQMTGTPNRLTQIKCDLNKTLISISYTSPRKPFRRQRRPAASVSGNEMFNKGIRATAD
jgi:hypothetical protein